MARLLRHLVIDRLAVVPLLRRDRQRPVALRQLLVRRPAGCASGVGLPMISVRMPIMLWK